MKKDPNLIEPMAFEPKRAPQGQDNKKQRSVLLYWCLGGLVCLMLLGLFSAHSLTIETDPDNASLELSGGMSIKLGARYLLWNGNYELALSAPGYVARQETIDIVGSDVQRSYSLALLADNIKIEAVSPAQIRINGEPQGLSPKILVLQHGSYELVLNAPRYESYSEQLIVMGGGNDVVVNPVLKPAWADVSLDSVPSGAAIMLGEELMGHTPATLELLKGENVLLLTLPGYKSQALSVDVKAGVAQALETVALTPADATVQLSSRPSKAAVMLDGNYQGQTPLQVALDAGRKHLLEVIKAGYQTNKKQLRYASGESANINVTLKAKLGEVEIRHQEKDVQLYIAGVRQQRSKGVFKLAAVAHRIELRKKGYASFSKVVTPKPAFAQRIDARFSHKNDSKSKVTVLSGTQKNSLGQVFKLLRPYDFTMGASRREPGRRANEHLRPVTMNRAFYLSSSEVTNAEYRKFVAGHSSGRVDSNSLNGENNPVVAVTWLQAVKYCNWLSNKEGLKAVYVLDKQGVQADLKATGYRLPTEAEWAWAARAEKAAHEPLRKFAWGASTQPTSVVGNFADDSASHIVARTINAYNDGQIVSAPIGSYKVNQHGLADMAGNVSEWVHDYYGQSQLSAASNQQNPSGPAKGSFHVVRGSSWRHGSLSELRYSYRDYEQKSRDDLGFRLARTAE